MVETVCIAWFILEYFIRSVVLWQASRYTHFYRLAGSPEKIKFLQDGMNIIDVLAIMPFFVSLFFLGPKAESADLAGPGVIETEEESGVEDILQVFRIFKLARVLKLARHSPGLQVRLDIDNFIAIAQHFMNIYRRSRTLFSTALRSCCF